MDDLLSGKIVDWIPMNRICEILYNHRMADEQFLLCTDNTGGVKHNYVYFLSFR